MILLVQVGPNGFWEINDSKIFVPPVITAEWRLL